MRKRQIEVRVQPEQRNLAEMHRVQVRNHVEQQPQDFARDALEGVGKFVGVLGGKDALVADRFLRERHHVVDVLRRRHARLFALLVEPEVRAGCDK